MLEVEGLVSISIPFYNSECFLSEAIDSVLAQTYAHWELFLVDDGSSDRSTEIARGYAARLPDQIHYLQHTEHRNWGVTRTRNLGASKSKGEYLAFLDSDDVWLPNKLEHQVALMKEHPEVGLVYGPSEYWYDWDSSQKSEQDNCIPSLAPAGNMYAPPVLLLSSHPLGPYGAPCPSSFLLRRHAFDDIQGFVESFNPHTYQLLEDTAFLTKVYLSVPVFVTDCCSDRYRCHPGSIWHRTMGTNREESERRYYFHWLRQYLIQERITSREIWSAVRRQAWAYWLPLPASATRFLRRVGNRLSR